MKMYLTGTLTGGSRAALQEWLRFPREKSSISKSIVAVYTV
jgi:hypothetical protein